MSTDQINAALGTANLTKIQAALAALAYLAGQCPE